MCDERSINIVFQNHSIHAFCLEHIDVLALLNLICHIEDSNFFFFLFFFAFFSTLSIFTGFFNNSLALCFFRFLILLDAVFQSQIFSIQVFKENVIIHLICELGIFDAAEFDKWIDIIPVFLIIFTGSLAHSGQFIGYFLADVV